MYPSSLREGGHEKLSNPRDSTLERPSSWFRAPVANFSSMDLNVNANNSSPFLSLSLSLSFSLSFFKNITYFFIRLNNTLRLYELIKKKTHMQDISLWYINIIAMYIEMILQ